MFDLESDVPDVSARSENMAGHLMYWLPMLVLIAGNLFLGLCAPAVVDLIKQGLTMFG